MLYARAAFYDENEGKDGASHGAADRFVQGLFLDSTVKQWRDAASFIYGMHGPQFQTFL